MSLSESWDLIDSQDRKVVNYSKTAFAIIPTPVNLDSEVFEEFWRKANYYLPLFGVQRQEIASSIKVFFNNIFFLNFNYTKCIFKQKIF